MSCSYFDTITDRIIVDHEESYGILHAALPVATVIAKRTRKNTGINIELACIYAVTVIQDNRYWVQKFPVRPRIYIQPDALIIKYQKHVCTFKHHTSFVC